MALVVTIAVTATLSATALGTAIALRTDAGADGEVASQAVMVPPTSRSTPADDDAGVDAGPLTSRQPDPGGTEPPRADTTPLTSYTAGSGVPTTGSGAGTGAPLDLTRPENLAAVYTGDGVYVADSGSAIRLAAYSVIDSMVVTSSSALGPHDSLVLVSGDVVVEATVLGTDSITDIAVLSLDAEQAETFLASVALAWTQRPAVDLTPGVTVAVVPSPGLVTSPDDQVKGTILGRVERSLANDGSPVYGLLMTTAKRPDGMSGGLLTDEAGTPLGMIVNTDGYLARATPIEQVVAVAQAFLDWGQASEVRVGIEGSSTATGAAVVASVEPGSPAEAAGIAPGDRIVELDGIEIIDWQHLTYLVRTSGPGVAVQFLVERDSEPLPVTVTIGATTDTGG